MTTIIFLVLTFAMVLIQAIRERNMVNLISLLTMPYILIVLFNNTLFYRLGFYKISDRVLWLILGSLAAFFAGANLIAPSKIPILHERDNAARFARYRIDAMTNVLIVIGVIGLIKVAQLIATGQFSGENFEEAEGVMGNGLVGHLLLFSYSILPIVFLYWLEHKRRIKCLIATLLIVGITFSSLVKYNVIGVVVSLFIATAIYKKSLTRKSVVLMVSIVIVLFVGNYMLGYYLRETSVSRSFYFNHFWVYASGSPIYDDYIFDPGINTHLSIGYKLMTFLMAFPNMFIRKLTGGAGFFPHLKKSTLAIGTVYGQVSNVTDAFGYLFPAKGEWVDKLVYFVVIFLLGFLFSYIYMKAKRRKGFFNTFIVNLITYFVFFSFFGTFYINPGPWEILIYSVFGPSLFLRTTNLRRGKITLS